jgi:hypothetical protein
MKHGLQKSIIETDRVSIKGKRKNQVLGLATLILAMLVCFTYICCTTFSNRDWKTSKLRDVGSRPSQGRAEGPCKTEDITSEHQVLDQAIAEMWVPFLGTENYM